MNDWRLQGQEKYLKGVSLKLSNYAKYSDKWAHDHCEFCNKTFSEDGEGDLKEGYSTSDHYRWVCIKCYKDFKDLFKWE